MVKKKWILFALAAAAVGIIAALQLLTQPRAEPVTADARGFDVAFTWDEPIERVVLFYKAGNETHATAGRCTVTTYSEKYLMRCRLPVSLEPGVYRYEVLAVGKRGMYRVLWGTVRVGN